MRKIITIILTFILISSIILLGCTYFFVRESNTEEQHIFTKEKSFSGVSENGDVDWWPMKGHDASHTSFSTSEAPDTNNTFWIEELDGSVDSGSPVVADGKIFFGVGHSSRKVFGYDINGSKIWEIDQVGSAAVTSLAYFNGKVYIGAGDLYCVDADDGTNEFWTYNVNKNIGNPTISNENIYFAADEMVFCLDADTGDHIWNYTTGDNIKNAPAVSNGKVYFGSNDKKVYCVNAEDGTDIWNFTTGGSVGSFKENIVIYEDKIYASSDNENIYCLNAKNGSLLFTIPFKGALGVAYDNLYIGTLDGIYCINPDDGSQIWNFTKPSAASIYPMAPAIADGKVYFTTKFPGSKLFCLDAFGNGNGTTTEIWSYQLTSPAITNTPVVAYAKVFLLGAISYSGKLYCFGSNAPPATPHQPDGTIEGYERIEYTFSTSTTDQDSDQLWYKWDFEDMTTDWLGPYESGTTVTASHFWDSSGIYDVKVKVKDPFDVESDWSPVWPVTITPGVEIPQLIITSPSSVMEDERFDVTITVIEESIENVVVSANVTFNGQIKQTNAHGQVNFTAPNVDESTEYAIIASHDDYISSTKTITVLNQEEKKGWIWGYVTDNYGDIIKGASVCAILSDEDTTSSECNITDEQGRYHKQVLIGTYTVEASKSGYETITEQDIIVPEGEAIGLDFVLEKSGEEPLPNEIQDAIQAGLIGGEITLTLEDDEILTESKIYSDVAIELLEINTEENEVQFRIEGETGTGQIFLFTIDENVLSFSDEFVVEFDGEVIFSTDDFQVILSALSVGSDNPIYYITGSNEIVLYGPLSVHTITIYQIVETISLILLAVLYISIFVIAATSAIYSVVFSGTLRLRRKKKM